MRNFFIADTHLGHGNIIKYCNRPFLSTNERMSIENMGWKNRIADFWKSPESKDWRISRESIEIMDNEIIDNINDLVGKDDCLWHLGDFAMCPRKPDDRYYQKCLDYRDRINCRNVNLIMGNHDDWMIRDLFNEVYDLHHLRIGHSGFALCHYAMAIWDKSHYPMNLYGHSHSNAEELLELAMPGRKSMDVGVDNAYKLLGKYLPFACEEIEDILNLKQGFCFDHHTR